MDNLHKLLQRAKDKEIAAYIDDTETEISFIKGTWCWNNGWEVTRLIDFDAIEEAEDMSCYFLIDEDEDMPTKLSFAKKIKINELV